MYFIEDILEYIITYNREVYMSEIYTRIMKFSRLTKLQ